MTEPFWRRTSSVLILTFICCLLWGSAFPSVKIGYRLFSITPDDPGTLILFAGLRFTLSGVMVVLFGSMLGRRLLLPKASSLPRVFLLSVFQTIGQYFFFYIGLAHTTGVKSSVLVASGTFFSILVASLLFHYEKLTIRKTAGCLLGFLGVILIQLPASSIDLSVKWNGEGFILISALFYAFSSSYIKQCAKRESPLCLSGWQFISGGIVLSCAGIIMGGSLSGFTVISVLLLLYLAFISAGAYSLWSILLQYNPISRIAVFGFMNPVLGVILSALLLGEQNQAFSLYGFLSLVFVSLGIITVFYHPHGKRNVSCEQ